MEYNEFVTLEGTKMGSNGWGYICKNWNGVHEDWKLHSCSQARNPNVGG